MKAVRLHAYGDIDQFKLDEIPDPVPGEGEVLLKVAASGLNPVDLYTRQGFMQQFDPIDLPEVIGGDVAGTVVAVGAGVGERTPSSPSRQPRPWRSFPTTWASRRGPHFRSSL
jgi:NADPH:quinone reductase-like Zn-dependent oxidoreductase